MSKLYSKTQMKPLTIEDENGEIRIYKGFKLNTFSLGREAFKILTVFFPSVGSFMDKNKDDIMYDAAQSWTLAFQMLENNLEEDHFEDLARKLTGSLIFDGNVIEDIDAHFDKYPYDFLDVLAWAGKENFYDFFTQSHLVRSKWKLLKENMSPQMTELISKVFEDKNNKSNDINEESSSDT